MASDIEVEGLGELKRDLSKIYDNLNKRGLVKFMRPGAQKFRKAILQRVPVRSGALKRSLKVRVGKGKKDDPKATIYVSFSGKTAKNREGKMVRPFYGYFLENGTVVGQKNRKHRRSTIEQRLARGGRIGIQPRPFVWPAFEATYQQAADVILSNIEKSL